MDVTSETPPPEVGITLPTLPAIVLLPGDDKGTPFRYASTCAAGQGEVLAASIQSSVHRDIAGFPFRLRRWLFRFQLMYVRRTEYRMLLQTMVGPIPFDADRFFSGVGKVGPLMRWLQEHSSTPFELPALPHLSEADKPLFRKQVRERQELQAARAAGQS